MAPNDQAATLCLEAMEMVTREGITIRWREAVPLPRLVAVLGGA